MQQSKYLMLILPFILLAQGCKHDCEDVACFSSPDPIYFELIDKGTRENLFTNGTYKPEDINIIDVATEQPVISNFITENGVNLIQLNSIGWQTETVIYSINHLDTRLFELYIEAERLTENCCSFTEYNSIRIQYAEVEPVPNALLYKILIE
ncbi:MAG: hypothetical protein ACNS60_02480 [Candidatus Cyclobacteriaceae bacterium M2_1C_046]